MENVFYGFSCHSIFPPAGKMDFHYRHGEKKGY